MRLAMFDLDNTLLAGDSDAEWARFLIKIGVLDAAEAAEKNERFYEDYKQGCLDIQAFLAFQLQALARQPQALLARWHAQFMEEHILPLVTDAGMTLVQKHQAQGDATLIVTATNQFVTGPIAKLYGVDALIATELECNEQGEFTGRPRGIPSFREGKIARVEAWLASQGWHWDNLETSYFYSDSLNDLPLLSKVHHPVAVDPDPVLRQHANQAGWPILSLRA